MNSRASRVTRVTLDQDQPIAGGESITVFYIVVANSTVLDAEVDLKDVSGNVLLTIVAPAHQSETLEIEWVADKGLVVDGIGDANVVVTVFHSAGGS